MDYTTAIRQGDILFIQVDKKPDDCQLNHSLVLAEGEASGHKHQGDLRFSSVLQIK
ncbi:hypothetical protein [Ignavibacterium sp.]|uniref:hypothetical protein n=1 Tax=Ignavibacterium sp. TaxID=2651167 RepID=UPI00307FB314